MMTFLILLQATLAIAVSGPYTSPEYLLLRAALAEGSFAKEGLRVSLSTARGETGAAEALSQGTAVLAATSLGAALRHASVGGQPPRLVFGLTGVPPSALLVPVAHRDSIKTLPDLRGKTVGVVSPGNPEEPFLVALLSRFGIRLNQVNAVSLGERGLVSALERGEIHAGLIGEPWATRLVEEGKAGILADFRRLGEAAGALGGPTVHAAIFARGDTLPGADQLVPLARALVNALHRVETASTEELAGRLPSRVVGLPDDFRIRHRAARGIALPRGWVTSEALERSIELLSIRSPLPRSITLPRRPGELLSLGAVRKVLEELREGGASPSE